MPPEGTCPGWGRILAQDGVVRTHIFLGHQRSRKAADLRGRILMTAGEQRYDLPSGRGTALDSGIKHNVRALQESWFLLTVARRTEE